MGSKTLKTMEALKNQFAEQNLTKGMAETSSTDIAIIENKEAFLNITSLDLSEINNWGLDNTDIEFCKAKAQKIINHAANSCLLLGREFEEISQQFSKQGTKEGIYEKLIEYLGFNPRTVLRWRKRYSLFQMAKNNETKELIATIPTIAVEKLAKLPNEEIENILEFNQTKDDLIAAINTEKLEYKENNQSQTEKVSDTMSETFKYSEIDILEIFDNFNHKIESLTDSKKEKINKLISNIQKLLTEEKE